LATAVGDQAAQTVALAHASAPSRWRLRWAVAVRRRRP